MTGLCTSSLTSWKAETERKSFEREINPNPSRDPYNSAPHEISGPINCPTSAILYLTNNVLIPNRHKRIPFSFPKLDGNLGKTKWWSERKPAVRRAFEGMWSIRRSPSTVSDPEIATLAHCPLLPQLPYSVEELQPTGTALTYWWPSPSVTQCRNSTSRWSLPLPIATADQRKALRRIDQEWRWFQCKGKDTALSREVLKTKNLP